MTGSRHADGGRDEHNVDKGEEEKAVGGGEGECKEHMVLRLSLIEGQGAATTVRHHFQHKHKRMLGAIRTNHCTLADGLCPKAQPGLRARTRFMTASNFSVSVGLSKAQKASAASASTSTAAWLREPSASQTPVSVACAGRRGQPVQLAAPALSPPSTRSTALRSAKGTRSSCQRRAASHEGKLFSFAQRAPV